jgi:hypothetical protein
VRDSQFRRFDHERANHVDDYARHNSAERYARIHVGLTNVQIEFSEPLEIASATDSANYVFASGETVISATLDSSGKVVTLATSPLAFGNNYSITLKGIRDRAAEPNTILPNTVASFWRQLTRRKTSVRRMKHPT